MIQIYGSPRTSASRCYLVLEELALPYQPISVDLLNKREQKDPEFLKLNPNGKIPCLVDGDVVLWESLAINRYLCERYRPEFLGKDPATRGRGMQWSLWGNYELQQPMIDIFIQMHFVPAERRDFAVVEGAQEKLPGLLQILDDRLGESTWLAGRELTLADFDVVSAYQVTKSIGIPTDAYANCERWYEVLSDRPSLNRWRTLRKAPP